MNRTATSAAKKVTRAKPRRRGFPTDAESIELRRKQASRQRAEVKPEDGDGVFVSYAVHSAQWPQPYRVEIRALDDPVNSCTCPDFDLNGLGTCKHIERVLQWIEEHRGAHSGQNQPPAVSPFYEVFVSADGNAPKVSLQRPPQHRQAVERSLAPLFDESGRLHGVLADAVPALRRAVASLSSRSARHVRISFLVGTAYERDAARAEQEAFRTAVEQRIERGKLSLDFLRHALYPYQREGTLHLALRGRAMLADEMGLGKTVQAIAACELLRRERNDVRRVLVVCPASLKAEWAEQIQFFTGSTARVVYGSRRERLRAYREDHFYVLCNYEQIRNDVADINQLLAPDIIALDEAQRIKNWPTKTAKTIKRLESPFRFVLTGTPLENRIEELYSLVEFVDPHLFGSLFRFQREFMEVSPDGEVSYRNLHELHSRVRRVMLRRRKEEVEGALPGRSTKQFMVPMTKEQRLRYGEYEYEVAKLVQIAKRRPLRKEEQDRLQIMLACMRMTCDSPYIMDQECRDCPKLEELEPVLDEVLDDPQAKVIIFSEWVKMLDLVKELAQVKGIAFAEHTGRIPQKQRRIEIRRFKDDPACRLFLSSDSGSTGLNLQAANVVINMDLPWNPAKLEQRIARAWRKHQIRPVRVINFVTENSIEHSMLDKLSYKRQLADGVLDGRFPSGDVFEKRGRKAFLHQVQAVMGGEDAEGVAAPEAAPSAAVDAARALREDLSARHAGAVRRVEKFGEAARLVLAERESDAPGLRETCAALGAQDAEVIGPDTLALFARLQERGLLQMDARLMGLAAPEGEAGGPRTEAEPRYPEEARACLAEVDRKLRMARVLAAEDLYEEAVAPLRTVLSQVLIAVSLFCTGERDGEPDEETLPEHFARTGLPGDALTLHRKLKTEEKLAGGELRTLVDRSLDAVRRVSTMFG